MRNSPSLSLAPRKGFRQSAAQIVRYLPQGFALTAALLAASGCDQPDLKLRGGLSNNAADVGTDAGVDGGSDGSSNNLPTGGFDPEGDDDGDAVRNANDNCIYVPNPNQADADVDGIGDVCEDAECISNGDPACRGNYLNDSDGDTIGDSVDNCVGIPSANRDDSDNDGVGDVCDEDKCVDGSTRVVGSTVGVCTAGIETCVAEGFSATGGTINDWVLTTQPYPLDGDRSSLIEQSGDGLDNDCDGAVDEGDQCATVGDVILCGLPAGVNPTGVCMQGFQLCLDDHRLGDCSGTVLPSAEVLDGLDNNCDGRIDENSNGQPCATGREGQCARGTTLGELRNGTYILFCNPIVAPTEETCNGIDDDCDGEIDEGRDGDGFAMETRGVDAVMVRPGDVVNGVAVCGEQGPFIAVCSTAQTTKVNGLVVAAEACGDHLDNDCDGTTDENCGGGVPGRGAACGTPVGECTEGRLPVDEMGETSDTCVDANGEAVVTPAQEICDNNDNDCDGSTDESLGKGDACNHIDGCSDGVTVCAADGTVVCDTTSQVRLADGGDCIDDNNDRVQDNLPLRRVLSVANPREIAGQTLVVDEVCSGIALDENGEVVPNANAGRCAVLSRAVAAVDGLAAACPSDALRVAEIPMNRQDDNCDGQTDENDVCHVAGQQAVCNVPAGIVDGSLCHGGLTTCVDGQWTGCVGVVSPTEDVCDGVDNDCDGVEDNGFRVGEVCNLPGRCGNGVLRCAANGEESECSSKDSIQAETCNRVDDDCNGFIDNGFNVGRACFGSPNNNSQCHIRGVEECSEAGDGTVCSTSLEGSQHPDSREVCDGIDNNCDDTVDEGFNIGTSCSVTCADNSVVNGTVVCRDQRSSGCSVTVANNCN